MSLVSKMLDLEMVKLNVTRDYSIREFNKDMRGVLEKAGVEGTGLCLLIEDHHLIASAFLEMFNSLISTGEIPGLFKPEEMEGIFS